MMTKDIKIYSAVDLLDKVLEFTEMTPNLNDWNLNSLKTNPPRQIRLRQIEALLMAFCGAGSSQPDLLSKVKSVLSGNHKMSIESFLRGDFIRTRTMAEYEKLAAFIEESVRGEYSDIEPSRSIRADELAFIFPMLINFKKQIRSLLTFNSGWLEASSKTARFSIYLTNSIANNLVGKYDELDNIIEQFINPGGLTFSKEELIAQFNFPVVNLNEIDMDFI